MEEEDDREASERYFFVLFCCSTPFFRFVFFFIFSHIFIFHFPNLTMPSVHSTLSARPQALLISTILGHIINIFKKYGTKALGTYLLYILLKYRNTALGVRPRPELKSPRGFPLLGNTVQLLTRNREENYQIQTKLHEEYGRIYAMTILGLGRVINVSEPEALDHILRVNFLAYEKG